MTAPEEVEARVDPRQVRQVLWNLLRNALEASGEKGAVEVVVREDTGDLVLEVIDEGEGIPEAQLPHIFEPFRTTKRGGTGLGLAVVHRIVQSHEATIEIDSPAGEGTTVRIRFPGAIRSSLQLRVVGDGG
jgi:signal transduction histidine kinase